MTKYRVSSLALSPDAKWVATGGSDGELALWRLTDEAPTVVRRHGSGPVVVAIAPDGASVISGGRDTTALVWDVAPN